MLCCDTPRGSHSRLLACYSRMYCVPIATLNQKKRTRFLCLGESQIKWRALILHGNENEVHALARLAFYENFLVGQESSVRCPH